MDEKEKERNAEKELLLKKLESDLAYLELMLDQKKRKLINLSKEIESLETKQQKLKERLTNSTEVEE